MRNRCALEIVYTNWPEELDAWIRVDRKLDAMKNACSTGPVDMGTVFDPDEMEVFLKLWEYLMSEYEKTHGTIPYIVDKFGPSGLMLVLKELIEKLT